MAIIDKLLEIGVHKKQIKLKENYATNSGALSAK